MFDSRLGLGFFPSFSLNGSLVQSPKIMVQVVSN